MSIARVLKQRFVLYASYALTTSYFVKRAFRGETVNDWRQRRVTMVDRAALDDVPVGLALRLIFERGYREVIEIGTSDGARISTLKALVPEIVATGLDIGPEFASPFERNGVTFAQYNQSAFDQEFSRPLVLVVMSLIYFEEDDLLELFGLFARRGIDVLFFEAQPFYNIDGLGPIDRRLNRADGYYHDYDRLLQRAGLQDELGSGKRDWFYTASPKTFEYARTYFATGRRATHQ